MAFGRASDLREGAARLNLASEAKPPSAGIHIASNYYKACGVGRVDSKV